MTLGSLATSIPDGHFLRLIYSRDINKHKLNKKIRSIHDLTFSETKIPDRLVIFDFEKLTLKIITSVRKHKTFQFFAKKSKKSVVLNEFSDQSVEKQKSYAILHDR
jgi:hypothetical protein